MRTKIILSILVGIVVVSLVLLTSCCKHEWKDATCTEPATCAKCGISRGYGLGHKYGEGKTLKEPTCTETGVRELTCTVCGEKRTTEIPVRDHKWVFVNEERTATCTEKGKKNYKCLICNATSYKMLEKLPHQYKDGYCRICFAEDPKGVKFKPSDDEKEQIRRIKTLSEKEIRKEEDFYYLLFSFSDLYGDTVVAPCVLEMKIVNEKDETVYKAKRILGVDDYSTWYNAYRKEVLASPKIMRSDIMEGSSSKGTLYFTIKFIDVYFEESSLAIYGLPVHSFGKEEILREATCGTEGTVRRTCSACGKVVEETIPATGRHSYRKGTVAVEPSCITEGLMEYACTVCGTVGRTETIEELEHSFENDKCTYCGTLRIGSKGPAGGFVFYDCDLDNQKGNRDGLMSSECGWRFLEAAPKDVGTAVFGYYRNSPNGENLYVNGDVHYYKENCTREGIGYGRSNTEMLVDAMGDSAYVSYVGSEKTKEYAPRKCLDYSYGGYDDWYLPSKDELNLMYKNLHRDGLGSFASDSSYWSSSEYDEGSAWRQDFDFGSQYGYYYRSNAYRVRPVRAF